MNEASDPIPTADLAATAALARLHVGPGEEAALALRLADILAHFRVLQEARLPAEDAAAAAAGAPAAARPQQVLTQAEVLANAPAARSGHFVVPRMIDA